MTLQLNQFTESAIQGQIDLKGFGSNIISARVSNSASGALMPLVPGQAVKVANEAGGVPSVLPLASNTDVTNGFVVYNVKDISYAADSRLEVALFGTVQYMTSGGAINRWANVEVVYNASGGGTVITSAGTNPIVGFAVDQATASGQIIRVYIINAQELGSNSIGNISGLQAALNALNASVLPTEVDTPITTVGNGTLTAAGLVGKFIKRSGPTSAFSDATDTAVNIVAALQTYLAAASFEVTIKNTTQYAMTITAGVGVTITGSAIVPPLASNRYLMTMTSGTAVVLEHLMTAVSTSKAPLTITNLTTVGAGTITGAGIAGGVTNRTGSTGAFTDTTDTAVNIVAALENAAIGEAFTYIYYNNTGFPATLAGGSGVTLAGDFTYVPAGGWCEVIVQLTSLTAVTMTGIESGLIGTLPPAQFVTGTTATTFAAGELTGAAFTVYTNTQGTPGSLATRTATQMIADLGNAYIGQTWMLRIVNGQGTGTLTLTGGTGVTLTGLGTMAANTWRDFVCTITSIASPAITLQDVGVGTFS